MSLEEMTDLTQVNKIIRDTHRNVLTWREENGNPNNLKTRYQGGDKLETVRFWREIDYSKDEEDRPFVRYKMLMNRKELFGDSEEEKTRIERSLLELGDKLFYEVPPIEP
jgi:hypothetical protein